MEWPIQDEKTPGKRKPVTTPTNHAIWAAAMEAAMVERPDAAAAWKERLLKCNSTKWRNDYMHLVEEFVNIQARCSSETILKMCNAGLEAANQAFVFRRPPGSSDDTTVSIEQAFSVEPNTWEGPPFETITYTGKQEIQDDQETPFQLASPYGTDAEPIWLKGGYMEDDINQDYTAAAGQLDAWAEYGCMEPSAAEHARNVMALSNVVPLVQDKTFVLLGLTSEMGPALHLLKIPHAHILGVARGGNKIDDLVRHLEKHGATSTKLQIPCSKNNDDSGVVQLGANLLTQGPQIARWIAETAPKDRSIVLLPLAYMDGEANVRVTVAMDNIVTLVQKMRRGDDISLAYLTSPATVYTIPPAAAMDAKERYEQTGAVGWPMLFSALSFGQWLNPVNTWKQLLPSENNSYSSSTSSHDHNVVVLNGMVNMQGPNYACAKTMQQWRCMSAAAMGYGVCAPHAPPTRTYSIQHNVYAAGGLEGLAHVCPPTVAFDVQPCSSLMTAILLDQLSQMSSSSSKKANNAKKQHPMELFWDGSVHGGCWRSPYSQDNSAKAAFLVGLTVGKIAAKYPPQAMGPRPRESQS